MEKQKVITSKIVYFFVSPHLDDVVLSCGGFIRHLTEAGEHVIIATVITADVPVDTPLSTEMRRRHNLWRLDNSPFAARRQEDVDASAILGAQYIHLDLLDAIYRRDSNGKPLYIKNIVHAPVHPDDLENYVPALCEELKRALSTLGDMEVRVFCPLAIGKHVDHVIVRAAVESICDSKNLIYFEDFPYVIKPDVVQPQLNNDGESWQSTIFELTPAEINARIAATACYVSQIPKMFPSKLQHWKNRIVVHLPTMGRFLDWSTDLNDACRRMALSTRSYINQVGGERYWTSNGDGLPKQSSSNELAKSATSSFNWNLAGSIARYGAGFIINIVLARILGPEPYGLVAVAYIFISIGNLIIDSGLNSGLVQKREINDKDIHYVLTIQLFLAFIIGGLIIGIAPLIAKFYHQPAIIPVLQVLTTTLFFQAASQTSTALLKRKLNFKRIQQAQITAYLVGYLGIGLPLAYSGYGVWSLVFAQLIQSLLYLGLVYAMARHSLGLVFRDSGGISRFGVNILGANIANWIISNYDNTSIGWAYGTTSLGLYGRAWTLAMTPVGIVVSSAQSVLFSASSKLQGSVERVKDAFLGVFTIFGIILFPFSICEALVAYDLIQFVYGDKWLKAVPIMEVLPLAMPFFALMALQGPVLAGLGKPEVEFKLQWFVLGFTLIVFMFAIQSSIQMIIWSVLAIYVFRFITLSLATFKILHVSRQDIKSTSISIFLFSGAVTPIVFLTGQFLSNLPIPIKLLAQALAGLTIWILVFVAGWNHILPTQVQSLINRLIPRRYAVIFNINQAAK